ncbi:trimeric intracellular cation channel family protein [Bacillus sp. 123MFChir2]|uniref:trimeric intracellular cation channel family protein n=1 Tax=Bacillus sp. 123MFChir2 TaxID=1169144 RepID=UPI000369E659|nr:trimeric intracellular cation channel family protein [Bacillus sp. 123MFChir2]
MAWDLFSIIGTIAFALSGAIIAMEEEYDIFGVYILGMATAFGGGALRNLLIGYPIVSLWQQDMLFEIAMLSMTIIFLFPNKLIRHWKRWENITDAIGLSAFAIQGALYAQKLNLPISATIVAAVLTGIGGGIIRDLLARRKPLVLRAEIYALWTILAGFLIGAKIIVSDWALYVLFLLIVCLRMVSLYYKWHLPHRSVEKIEHFSER